MRPNRDSEDNKNSIMFDRNPGHSGYKRVFNPVITNYILIVKANLLIAFNFTSWLILPLVGPSVIVCTGRGLDRQIFFISGEKVRKQRGTPI